MSYKSVVNTQIDIYNSVKNKHIEMSENEVLNYIITSRVESWPRVDSKLKEYAHYESLLQNSKKTLEDVIIDIVNYEYVDSSRDDLIKKGFSNKEIKNFRANMKKYIKEKIEDNKGNIGYTNIQFRKFKRDYKSFLLVFFVWIILGLFNYLFNLIENLQDKILIPILIIIVFSWLFYTVKVVIDTFRIFKIIKPSRLQIGISIFLFWLFWPPLVMGLYVIHLMNKYKQQTNKINLGDLGNETSFEPFKPSEEPLSVHFAAQFISKEATLNTKLLIKQFPNYFQDIRIARQFYMDILCLYGNIYHRLGEDMIKDKKTIPSIVTLDERTGFFIGVCCAIIEEHSNEFPFLQSISLQFLLDAYREFHNWSRQYEIIYDAKNELSVKFDSGQIFGFSFIGQNTLVINFIAKEIKKLSIKEKDLDKFIFYLSDLIVQYLSDPVLKVFLTDYLSCDPALRRLIDEERKA